MDATTTTSTSSDDHAIEIIKNETVDDDLLFYDDHHFGASESWMTMHDHPWLNDEALFSVNETAANSDTTTIGSHHCLMHHSFSISSNFEFHSTLCITRRQEGQQQQQPRRHLEDEIEWDEESSSYNNQGEGKTGNYSSYADLWEALLNDTLDNADEFASQLKPASDIGIDQVMTSLYFNGIIFVILMASYEVLRRIYPTVYAARKSRKIPFARRTRLINRDASLQQLLPEDDSLVPFDWVAPVFGVPWSRVRKAAGLDAYFFLRYIRMCVRVTAVSTFWATIVLAPTYATGQNGAEGWYLISMANIEASTWRMAIPVVFMYFFTAFLIFVMKQEYVHYMELRMDFLGKGVSQYIHPQHHYSIMIENIPLQLRSDEALMEYFSKLYPNKIHSASVVIKTPLLNDRTSRRLRVLSRLEKAIALYHATGQRPTHKMGSSHLAIGGIDFGSPLDRCSNTCSKNGQVDDDDDDVFLNDSSMYAGTSSSVGGGTDEQSSNHHQAPVSNSIINLVRDMNTPLPKKGTRVDSISYYTRELAHCNRDIYKLQQKNARLQKTGHRQNSILLAQQQQQHTNDDASSTYTNNVPPPMSGAEGWLRKVMEIFEGTADVIMDDSRQDNELNAGNSLPSFDYQEEHHCHVVEASIPFAEDMTSMYGTLATPTASLRKKSSKGPSTSSVNSSMMSSLDSSSERSARASTKTMMTTTTHHGETKPVPPASLSMLREELTVSASTETGEDAGGSSSDATPTTAISASPTTSPIRPAFSLDHTEVAQVSSSHSPTNHHHHFNSSMASLQHPLPPGKSVLKEREFVTPNARSKHTTFIRRIAGRLGLDFIVAGLKYGQRQIDTIVEGVVGSKLSSTGFVTFLDLASVTSAASVPLTHKPNVLDVSVAPEPRDIRWSSVHLSKRVQTRREAFVNVLLTVGVILWSIPLTAIQLFATADKVAMLPGMDWVLTLDDGTFKKFINGYLPVIAFMGLILILPVIFECIAIHYEHRKTFSEVQHSMMGRYFYYQLANIYITVTAGSLWRSLADIMDHPSFALHLLGQSLPTMVGYFISLLITKILAGLPAIILRGGALSRMMVLRLFTFREEKLTQRELQTVYRPENVLYGWEYPAQLLVIVICFSYACICPIILPFGAIFFVGSLMVYKKQVLYVFQPVYESGGTMFPTACDRTLIGLICGHLTLIGYTVIRQCYHEPMWLFPLPVLTIYTMGYFRRHYAIPSKSLSMERAMECDRISDLRISFGKGLDEPQEGIGLTERRREFDKNSYTKPVLDPTTALMEPMHYRKGEQDIMTDEVRDHLRKYNRYAVLSMSRRRVSGGGVVGAMMDNNNDGSFLDINENIPTPPSYQNPPPPPPPRHSSPSAIV